MCTNYGLDADWNYLNLNAYKVFSRRLDGSLYSPFAHYNLIDETFVQPYNEVGINVCNSEEGFHAFTDLATAVQAAAFLTRQTPFIRENSGDPNYQCTYELYRINAINIFKVGVWGDRNFYQGNPVVLHCKELLFYDQIDWEKYNEL